MSQIRFEEGFKRLEELVKKLEDPKTQLEESFEIYKEAMDLTRILKEKIDNMEKEIKVIIDDGNSTE
jgi:exodeoxyribonuclease VII small subunit